MGQKERDHKARACHVIHQESSHQPGTASPSVVAFLRRRATAEVRSFSPRRCPMALSNAMPLSAISGIWLCPRMPWLSVCCPQRSPRSSGMRQPESGSAREDHRRPIGKRLVAPVYRRQRTQSQPGFYNGLALTAPEKYAMKGRTECAKGAACESRCGVSA